MAVAVLVTTTVPGVPTGASGADPSPPRCHGAPATIVGDSEYVLGTPGDDVIFAPDSEVHAFDGDDDICAAFLVYAGPGDDHVTMTGNGDTEVQGDAGNDRIVVGHGFAEISGGPGGDTITTGKGSQYVSGGQGRDQISTGPGRDRIDGQEDADVLRGGAGDDDVRGSGGSDDLHGGGGDDALSGGRGDDVAYGGPGADSCERTVETRRRCRG
ncbi:MAG: calcium-binding protein [Nocardioides sp.]